jgi:CheY-like chemotaxis protein
VSVTDSGAGISRSARQRLFMPFERLEATSAIEGTGVGLALSKSLVEAMGGSIGVDSVVGRGSTFWVRFPRHLDDGDLGDSDADVEPPATPTRRGDNAAADTVLYVEDNLANVRVMERLMRNRTEHLEIAMQGGLAIELTRELQPMVVLLDLHLADMSGVDVLSAVKADPLTSAVPVVILSADATEGTQRRVLELGADAYLTKPIDIVELTTVLDRIRSERSVL